MAFIRDSPFSEYKRSHHAFPVSVQPASSSVKSFRKRVDGCIGFPAHSVRSRRSQGKKGGPGRGVESILQRGSLFDTYQYPQNFLLITKFLGCCSILGPTLNFTERFI